MLDTKSALLKESLDHRNFLYLFALLRADEAGCIIDLHEGTNKSNLIESSCCFHKLSNNAA